MKQVQNSATNKLPSNKAVLVLGENESGKTSLIAKMQGNEEPRKGSGLEYHHLLVRDEYRDEQTRLGLWVLDGDPFHQNLLIYALNEETFADTSVILTASMTTPWSLIESLEKWAEILASHIDKLNIPSEKMKQFKNSQIKRYQEYISPGDEIESLVQSPMKNRDVNESFAEATSPSKDLPYSVLARNLGLDIIVVITKTDFMSNLEKNLDYKEEHFDFIQQSIRKFCLTYGASLFYVSAKINKNTDLLYKYLVHRIYGLPFKTPALVVEKDALFIPCGWDNEKKISILYENIQTVSPDDPFDKVICKPDQMNCIGQEVEVTAEEDQVFLTKMQAQLNQNISSSTANQAQSFRPSPVQKSTDRKSFGTNAASTPVCNSAASMTIYHCNNNNDTFFSFIVGFCT